MQDYSYVAVVMLNARDKVTYDMEVITSNLIISDLIRSQIRTNNFTICIRNASELSLHMIANNPIDIITSTSPRVGAIVLPEQNTILYADNISESNQYAYAALFTTPSLIYYLQNVSNNSISPIGPTVLNLTDIVKCKDVTVDKMNNKYTQLEKTHIRKVLVDSIDRVKRAPLPSTQPTCYDSCVICSPQKTPIMRAERGPIDNSMNECATTLLKLKSAAPTSKIITRKTPLPFTVRKTRAMAKKEEADNGWKRYAVKSIGCI